jgi:hypothetical protein
MEPQTSVEYRIVNQGRSPLALSDLKIRYWLGDTSSGYVYMCDYAAVEMPNAGPTTVAGNQVVATFVAAPNPTAKAMQFMELSFPSVIAMIPPSLGAQVKGRFYLSNNTQRNASNDYSYVAADSQPTASTTSTVYNAGTLVWGVEPGGSSAPVTTTDAGDP